MGQPLVALAPLHQEALIPVTVSENLAVSPQRCLKSIGTTGPPMASGALPVSWTCRSVRSKAITCPAGRGQFLECGVAEDVPGGVNWMRELIVSGLEGKPRYQARAKRFGGMRLMAAAMAGVGLIAIAAAAVLLTRG